MLWLLSDPPGFAYWISVAPVFLALVCDVYCDFFTFPFGILGQVWYLIV